MITISDLVGAPSRVASRIADDAAEMVQETDLCFAAGTHVTTARGDIPVEQLKVSDLVRTRAGSFTPIVAVSRHRIDAVRLRETPDLVPVTVRRNALGDNMPRHDLQVTAGQRFDLRVRDRIGHIIRHSQGPMSQRREDTLSTGVDFIVFRMAERAPVRVEHVWTEATPAVRALMPGAA